MALAPAIIRGIGVAAVKRALFPSPSESDQDKEAPASTAVSSSAISNIAWKDETITVTFNRGGTYDYPGGKDLYEDFVNAPSIGAYFNQYIKPRG